MLHGLKSRPEGRGFSLLEYLSGKRRDLVRVRLHKKKDMHG